MSGRKRKKNISSDFKRIKAKVGKKAQRQNDTDVSFQSASLRLGQSIDQNNEQKSLSNPQTLTSSRGKSLYHLVSTASAHPAAAARTSSLKGILDIVKSHPPEALVPNLSTLIPACVHSCVDEDKDVREVGIDALSSLLNKLQEKRIQPFGALLIARVSSALHSLDASTRIHGVKMVNMISTGCPSLAAMFIDKLLPPFSGLLADHRTGKSIDDILQSLISLLRVTATKISVNSQSSSYGPQNIGDHDVQIKKKTGVQPDLVYATGRRSRNTILRSRQSVHFFPYTIESITNLSQPERFTMTAFNLQKKTIDCYRQQSAQGNSSEMKCKTILMSKLRDSLIEAINLENEPTNISNSKVIRSSTTTPQDSTNYSRVTLLLRSVRYLYKSFKTNTEGNFVGVETEFGKSAQQIVEVLLDMFPFDHHPSAINSAKDNSTIRIDQINAAIVITILDISQEALTTNNGKEKAENYDAKHWMKIICSHVIPRLSHLIDIENLTTSSDLDMTCKLVRRLGMHSVHFADLDSVLVILLELFFCDEDKQLSRSIAGRRISLLIMDLIDWNEFELDCALISPTSKALIQFVKSIPFYLEAWSADFLYESRRILQGLHRLVRKEQESCDSHIVRYIRVNWHRLVIDRGNSASVFEMYPCDLQQLYVGLVVLQRAPSDPTLSNLASICCRSTLKSDVFVNREQISVTIVHAIQKIRKTIPMQLYLTFLVQSVGLTAHAKEFSNFETNFKNVFEREFFRADSALNRVARALVEPGSMQVFRMILPQLFSWQQTKRDGQTSSTAFLLKTRASYIILAHFFLLHDSKQKIHSDEQPSIFDHTHGIMTVETMTHSIVTFIDCIARNKMAMDFHSRLTSPLVAIISSRQVLLHAVIRNIAGLFRKPIIVSKMVQKNLLLIVIDWMKDPRLMDYDSSTQLSSASKSLLEAVLAILRCDEIQENQFAMDIIADLTQ